jgi:hypothetical protein
VRWLVNNFYITEKKRPTLETIHRKAVDDIGFQGNLCSLQRLRVKLGFKLAKPEDNKEILIKGYRNRPLRISYLRTI